MWIWVDDIRPPVNDKYNCWVRSVDDFKDLVRFFASRKSCIERISLDHDAGDYAKFGGDYINCLNFLEELKHEIGISICSQFHFHSMNPVGVENMKRIINRNGGYEVY